MARDGVLAWVRWLALGALFLIPFTPLIVANSSFFPFITGKAFFFRILTEIAVGAWVLLALFDKEYRPRFSWIGGAAFALIAWMFIADLFAVNAEKALWSNFERMEGFVLLIHLYGFFLAAGNVLRVEKKWRAWFLTSLGVSTILVFHAFLQLSGAAPIHQGSTRIDASFGNSAYFAIYLLFNTCIAFWLALTEERRFLRYALLALGVVEGYLVFLTQTRGTILALLGAAALSALLTALTAGKRARTVAVGALLTLLVFVGGFLALRESAFVQENGTLERIASISLADGEVRFTIWGMAWEGFKERPLLGWGQEGFNYVFNKYYEPSLYAQEPWFDRAHNAFIDWLMAGGLPALAAYLALFVSAIVLLWRRSELSRPERIALTAALLGYAFHNLFVFDNLYSYVYFFAILALIESQVGRQSARLESYPEVARDNAPAALAAGAALLLVFMYVVNAPSARAARDLITAISPSGAGIETNVRAFEALLLDPPPQAQEIREQLVSFAGRVVGEATIPAAIRQEVAALTVREFEAQNTAHPGDMRTLIQLSAAYRVAGDVAGAREALQQAVALSPQKPHTLLQLAFLEWEIGAVEEAEKHARAAYELAPEFSDLAAYAAAGHLIAGNRAAADALLTGAFGTTTVDHAALSYAYYRIKDYASLISLWRLRIAKPDATADAWFGLAAAEFLAGDASGAARTVAEVSARFPQVKERGDAFLKEMAQLRAQQ